MVAAGRGTCGGRLLRSAPLRVEGRRAVVVGRGGAREKRGGRGARNLEALSAPSSSDVGSRETTDSSSDESSPNMSSRGMTTEVTAGGEKEARDTPSARRTWVQVILARRPSGSTASEPRWASAGSSPAGLKRPCRGNMTALKRRPRIPRQRRRFSSDLPAAGGVVPCPASGAGPADRLSRPRPARRRHIADVRRAPARGEEVVAERVKPGNRRR